MLFYDAIHSNIQGLVGGRIVITIGTFEDVQRMSGGGEIGGDKC